MAMDRRPGHFAINDMIEGMIRMMDCETGSRRNAGLYQTSPFRLSGANQHRQPYEVTIREIAGNVVKLAKSKSRIVYEDLPEDDREEDVLTLRKAKQLLDWTPKVGLDEVEEAITEYFRNHMAK